MKSKGKIFVIAGFALLILVMSTGLWLIFKNLKDFSERITFDEERRELLIVGNIINTLYEAEVTNDLLTYNCAEKYMMSYDSIRPLVEARMDTLKQLSVDSNRVVMLDSISVLLSLKNENLESVLVLMDSVRKAPSVIRESTSSYISPRLNKDISDYLIQKEVFPDFDEEAQAVDTTVVRGERKGLFRRLGDAITGKQDSTVILRQQSATVIQKEYELILDTVINMVKYSERLDLERQQLFYRQLVNRQSAMSQHNQVLTSQIDNLLKTIEQEEIARALELLQERERVLGNSSKTLLYVSLVAHLIALVFGALFIIDANKLKRTRRQLEESNRRINDLLHSREKLMLAVSHDIKSPMGAILGYLELLEVSRDEDNIRGYRENMRRSGEHILELVNSMLDLHKIESGTWTEHKVDYNLDEVVKVTLDTFKQLAEQKRLTYKVENHIPNDVIAYGEPFMIRLIISNLISNAIKYTTEGSVAVQSRYNHDDGLFELEITDTGIGIDPEHQKLIFQEFTQLNAEHPDEYIKGSGLGLAITRGLIEELGGTITLDSEKGRGSTFTVELPIELAGEEIAGETKDSSPKDLQNLSVLLVDDDIIQLSMSTELLRKKGITAKGESDVFKVVSLLKKEQFDVVFIDIQMPGKNGFVLAEELRTSGLIKNNKPRLIALTAQSDLSKDLFVNAGFNDFLYKPFTADELVEKLNRPISEDYPIEQTLVMTTPSVEVLVEMIEDDEETAKAILQAFTEDAQMLQIELEKLRDDNNYHNASHMAHKMLPLFKMMKAEELSDTLVAISKQKEVSKEAIVKAVEQVRVHCENAVQMMGKE